MIDPGGRIGGEVRILSENLLGADVLPELDEKTVAADQNVEGVEGLHRIQLVVSQETLTQWGHAQIDKCLLQS